MAEATKQVGPPAESGAGMEPRLRDLGLWLVALAWGTGAFIYFWLLVGVFEKREYWNRDYWNQIYEVWSFANLWLPLLCGFAVAVFSFFGTLAKKPAEGEGRQLFRIVVAVLPALFLVSALAVLTLTLATYNADWKEALQGIATAFAALIAAVGVVVSVAVSYKTGEENRLAQQNNLEKQLQSQQTHLETQLEHQRALEEEKGKREQQKLDAELIKNLNDRLHEIISRRYGNDSDEVSASYFQLASLYKDWETLSEKSSLIDGQKISQQSSIIKILFGTCLSAGSEGDDQDAKNRSDREIRVLNSILNSILPNRDDDRISHVKFDFSYLNLNGLDFGNKDLRGSNFTGASMVKSRFSGTLLSESLFYEASLSCASLVKVNLNGAHLEGADLSSVIFQEVTLEGAYIYGAALEGSKFYFTNLNNLNVFTNFENQILRLDSPAGEVRESIENGVIDQFKVCAVPPMFSELQKIKNFTPELAEKIKGTHQVESSLDGSTLTES